MFAFLSKKKKLEDQFADGVPALAPKPKRFQHIRRGIHRSGDILLIFLHCLFPLTVSAFLVYRENQDEVIKGAFFNLLGYVTGGLGLTLQISMIVRTLSQNFALRYMDVLVLCIAVVQFLFCIIGPAVTFVLTGKSHFDVATVSIANAAFCILPIFLTVTSIIAEKKANEDISKRAKYSYLFVSNHSSTPTIIKKTAFYGEVNRTAL